MLKFRAVGKLHYRNVNIEADFGRNFDFRFEKINVFLLLNIHCVLDLDKVY